MSVQARGSVSHNYHAHVVSSCPVWPVGRATQSSLIIPTRPRGHVSSVIDLYAHSRTRLWHARAHEDTPT